MPPLRAFYAHARNMPDADIDFHVRRIQDLLGPTYVVISGRDEFRNHGTTFLGFCEWVGSGVDYQSRRPNFDVILCPDEIVGKATADICTHAIKGGKPVLVGTADGGWADVRGVTPIDANSWKAGWKLES